VSKEKVSGREASIKDGIIELVLPKKTPKLKKKVAIR
jgi:HSP20 family molecular chaperone IbpA